MIQWEKDKHVKNMKFYKNVGKVHEKKKVNPRVSGGTAPSLENEYFAIYPKIIVFARTQIQWPPRQPQF